MPEVPVRLYEGMFLLSQSAAGDLGAAMDFLKGVFARAEAEVLVQRKWDERKLAFPIKGQKRGTYILAIFRARASQIANIKRDCDLSEQVVRTLLISGEHLGEVEIEASKHDAPPPPAEPRPRPEGDRVPRDMAPGVDALADISMDGR